MARSLRLVGMLVVLSLGLTQCVQNEVLARVEAGLEASSAVDGGADDGSTVRPDVRFDAREADAREAGAPSTSPGSLGQSCVWSGAPAEGICRTSCLAGEGWSNTGPDVPHCSAGRCCRPCINGRVLESGECVSDAELECRAAGGICGGATVNPQCPSGTRASRSLVCLVGFTGVFACCVADERDAGGVDAPIDAPDAPIAPDVLARPDGVAPADGPSGADVTPPSDAASACVCAAPLSPCAGTCVDVNTSEAHCGACGVACGPSEVCVAGRCARCSTGTRCGDACVDTNTDGLHCGACDNRCPVDTTCTAGRCVPWRADGCPAPMTSCGWTCANLSNSPLHCGRCGNRCREDQHCVDGACRGPSSATERVCGGLLVDTDTDPEHCGRCGHACCPGSVCSRGECAYGCGAPRIVCSRPCLEECNRFCADTSTDDSNCGACGNVCAPGQICSSGRCR